MCPSPNGDEDRQTTIASRPHEIPKNASAALPEKNTDFMYLINAGSTSYKKPHGTVPCHLTHPQQKEKKRGLPLSNTHIAAVQKLLLKTRY